MRAWLVMLAACGAQSGPRLISATPTGVPRLTQVTIEGEGMCAGNCATAGGEFVFSLGIPGTEARLTVSDFFDTEAFVIIPNTADIGPGTITLTVNGESSNAVPFEVTR